MLAKGLRTHALRGAIASLHPSATSTNILPRISQSLAQTRLLSNEVRTAIDKAVGSAPVVLFMKGTPETPQCGFSRTSIQILGLQGLDPRKFTAFNVLEDDDLRSGMYYATHDQVQDKELIQWHRYKRILRLAHDPTTIHR